MGACLDLDGDTIRSARVRIGGVGSSPIRAEATEEALAGKPASPELLAEAAALAFKPSRTMDNTDSEVVYRKKMTPVWVRRALEDCL